MSSRTIEGLNSTSVGGLSLQITEGSARDTTDTVTIAIPAGQTRTVSVNVSGPGGIDTGAVQPTRSYALYVVASGNQTFGLLSLSFAAPTVPGGAKFRRVGAVFTDGNGSLVAYRQVGYQNDRQVAYHGSQGALVVVNAVTQANFVAVPNQGQIPLTASGGALYVEPGPGSSTDLRVGQVVTRVVAPAGSPNPQIYGYTAPLWSTLGEYKTNGGPTTLTVLGYDDTV